MNVHANLNGLPVRAPRAVIRAVTLVEMLVVIGVLAVLLAIVVPATSSVRASSRSAVCQSNLRQLGIAASMYATQNRDAYPAAILYRMNGAGLVTSAWDFEHRPGGEVRPSVLWDFVKGPNEVQQCPDFLGNSTFGDDPSTGYNYNTSYIGAEGRFPEQDSSGAWIDGWRLARRGVESAQFRKTSTTALFGEGGWRGGANKFMRAPSANVEGDLPTVYGGGQAFRHSGCTHVCYLDGHVGGACDCNDGVHSPPALLESVMGFPRNGFLSDNDFPYDPR